MTNPGRGGSRSTISGGIQHGPVLQGRDFRNVHIGDIVRAAAAPVALVQLPALVAGFTGREAELSEMNALLDPTADGEAVVVSAVAGLAGVGKTALAIQAAHAARRTGWFEGGVLFIDMHGYDDMPVQPGQALDALLRALGVAAEHIPPGVEERAGLYRSKLAAISDPVLILADNASSEAQVRPLLPGPGPHRVIVTSRHTLAGLSARLLDVTMLDEEAGAALLDRVLRAARPDDDRIDADRAGAVRLTRMCGGLPLALQITAALLKADPSRTVSSMGDELADELHRLESLRYDDGSGTSAPSVAAAFELSYRQLDELTAHAFRLLPVNPGPEISTPAVAALTDLSARKTRRVVGQLVRAHLVEAAAGAEDRWRMHDLLRLYARQLSDADPRADRQEQARDRLLRYYLDTARTANAHLSPPSATPPSAAFTGRDNALAWLDAERPNLIAAVTIAVSTDRDQIAMRLPLAMAEYLAWRRRFDDILATNMISRDAAHRLRRRLNEAAALNNLGGGLREVRRFEEAITTYQEAATIFREAGDRKHEGDAQNNLGAVLREVGRLEESIAVLQDAIATYRDTGYRHGEGLVLNNLGTTLSEGGLFEEAITALQDAAGIYRDTGDRHGEGSALNNLGLALHRASRFEEAIAAFLDAAAIYRETGDRHGEGMVLNNLGSSLQKVGRSEEAITALQDAAAIFEEIGDHHGRGLALGGLGVALQEGGRLEEAITAQREAAAMFEQTGDRQHKSLAQNSLSSALREAGRLEEAITAQREAAPMFEETGDQHN